MLKSKHLMIFDIDGVLFNSEKANREYFHACLEKIGLSGVEETIEEQIAFMSLEQLLDEIIDDKEKAFEALNICRTISYDPYIKSIEPLFDFDQIFPILKNKFYLAAASNRGQSLITLFKHFNLFDYFSFKISSLEAPSKPNPEMLIRCCDHFKVPLEKSFFVGDSISDYNAALNAGIDFIWVGRKDKEPSIDGINNIIQYF